MPVCMWEMASEELTSEDGSKGKGREAKGKEEKLESEKTTVDVPNSATVLVLIRHLYLSGM
jgi:hypothetical protein